MNPRSSLTTKILLLALMNVGVLAIAAGAVVVVAGGSDFDSFLLTTARERTLAVGRAFALDLNEADRAALLTSAAMHEPVTHATQGEHAWSLPQPLSSFIGREREKATIQHLLETARLVTLVQIRELQIEDSSLQAVQPAVISHDIMLVFAKPPVIAKPSYCVRDILIIGDYRASVTASSEILGRVETEAGCISHRSCSHAKIAGTVSLGRVFDYF